MVAQMSRTDSELLLFEVLERAVRLYSHMERSCKIASRPGARTTAQLRIAREAQQLLFSEIQDLVLSFWTPSSQESQRRLRLDEALNHLIEIHTRVLVAVPRPHEPIELISYLRQTLLPREAEGSASDAVPEVFASEFLGDQAHDSYRYAVHSNAHIRREASSAIYGGNLTEIAEKYLQNDNEENQSVGYVSLPRIDLGNPCRWPSLLHEVGHFKLNSESIFDSFCRHVDSKLPEVIQAISAFSTSQDERTCKEELKRWLSECWCDAFASTMAGPAIFFAQAHAFLFCNPCYLTEPPKKGAKYPPAWFRLKILLSLVESRFEAEDVDAKELIFKHLEEEKRALERLFPSHRKTSEKSPLYFLLHTFREFIKREFSRAVHLETSNISASALYELIEDLKNGLPIPSVRNSGGEGAQRAATPAEILLAGWMHRNGKFKDDFLTTVEAWPKNCESVSGLIDSLKSKVARADETLKRSLQMAEWFRILDESAKRYTETPVPNNPDNGTIEDTPSVGPSGVLSDRQIRGLLASRDLRVIPLIDFERQISGTVVDLRLGHNFEVFFSNVHGVIDPLRRDSIEKIDSMEMDVDFLRSISIGPGQFLLGHTLEYVKLPDGIAAQIEGRSSFARLGLQIHMTANLVESGFDGCLTLEISNSGHTAVTLYPGMRIAQLRFFRLVTPPTRPYGSMRGGKYHGLLSHNKTQQFSDWEVDAFEKERKRLGIGESGG